MLTAEQNKLLTETGPGTPGGKLMRMYWQPIAKSNELLENAPVPIRIMSEDLVLYRDETGQVGLLGRFCSHRRTDLSFGRIEDGGLRCLYHGWLYDRQGNCLDTPAEPENSRLKCNVKHKAYPCVEKSGLIFTYMGEGEPPILPDYEFLQHDEYHRMVSKMYLDCNWLQALEGNIDPSHLSYLHRPVRPVDSRAVPGSNSSADTYYRNDSRPTLEYENAPFGLRIYSIRKSGESEKYVRITNFIMPNKAAIVGNEGRVGQGYQVNWHTPIDDTHHMRFDIAFNRVKTFSPESNRRLNSGDITQEGYLVRNLGNRYGQSRSEMLTKNYSGMGPSFLVHDAFAVESAGPINDRTQEMLGTTDIMIVQARRQILAGIEAVMAGKEPAHLFRNERDSDIAELVVCSEVIPASASHKTFWKERTRAKPAAE
ncbi:MAG TPA: Rieske 2Fe-2S domain-containing protein [Alphaproteobacteria bacterium]|jgi:phenylpropionate dioxygenase-like ring-hydroxylating dioxygenase large terminal subunit|nr:Rieske 2Fe-2S domain-containing protein [Alphaproteobacteria bacterium]